MNVGARRARPTEQTKTARTTPARSALRGAGDSARLSSHELHPAAVAALDTADPLDTPGP